MEIGLATGSNMFEMLNSRTDGHTHIQKQKESYCYSLILTRITGLDTPAAAEAESCSAVFLPWGVMEQLVPLEMLRKGQNLQEIG